MIQDLTPQQIDELINMIYIIHRSSQNTIVPILKKLKRNPTDELNNIELETLTTWHSRPEDTQQDDTYKVAKIFTYVIIKNLGREDLIQ